MAQPVAVPENNTAENDSLATANTIAGITSIVDAVDDVINDLNNMAAQINSLSKNAANEFACAKEHETDFLEVSSEIETLSEITSKNVKAISDSIQSIVTQMENAEVAGHDSLCTLADIQKEIEGCADAFSDLPHTTASLSEGTAQIAKTVQDLKSVSNTL
jgi:methyl-accepting chemotaxis protein